MIGLCREKMFADQNDIFSQSPFCLLCKLMGHFRIEANSREHAGKMFVDIESVNCSCLVLKNYFNSLSRFRGDSGSQCKPVTGSAWDHSKIYIFIDQVANHLA